MKKILIFGSNGGLGKSLKKKLNKNYLISFNKKKLNFLKKDRFQNISKLIKKNNPNVIINCSGILGNNSQSYEKVFDVNFGSNWDLIRFYLKSKKKFDVKIILIGSSGHNKGKRDYILYSASKSALNNLYKSSNDILKKKGVILNIFHPPGMRTKMIKNLKYKSITKKLNPSNIANKIISKYKIS